MVHRGFCLGTLETPVDMPPAEFTIAELNAAWKRSGKIIAGMIQTKLQERFSTQR
jgi:hypothetical protein